MQTRAPNGTRATLRRAPVAVALLLAACSPEPRAIAYGEDACEQCLMGIADERWGAEIVTRTGKVHTFDSVECMARYLAADVDPADVHSLWVTDFADPPGLVAVEDAFFLRSDNLRSPMGLGITAFGKASIRERAVQDSFGGDLMSWDDVLAYVAAAGPGDPRDHSPRHSRMLSRPEIGGHAAGASNAPLDR